MGILGRIRSTSNAVLRPMGLYLSKTPQNGGFALHQYHRADGTFDYERYKAVQTQGNVAKIDHVFVDENNMAFLATVLRQRLTTIKSGICHGTRRGLEQKWLSEKLGCSVVGTEISSTATQFPNTIEWDFHEVRPEWLSAFDFIYSNSYDHSYDPDKCLNAWMSCLRPGGICVLEHTNLHGTEAANELDPFGAELTMLPYLVATWGRGKFGVAEILKAPSNAHFVLIKNF